MDTRSEIDLVIAKDRVMVKERVAIRVEEPTRSYRLEYTIPITSAKAKHKNGKLVVKRLDRHTIEVQSPQVLSSGDIFAFQLSMLVEPEIDTIANLKILNWGALDLYRVICLFQPFQVIGFGNLLIQNGQWIYSDNLTRKVQAHIGRYRNSRIELGKMLKIKLSITYSIDCTAGGQIRKFTSFGPISNKRQSALLLNNDVKIEKDKNGNELYYWLEAVPPGEKIQKTIEWVVTIRQPPHISTDLGTIKSLNLAVSQSNQLREYLSGDPEHWNIRDNTVTKIIDKANKFSTIFQVHQFLFEFTNRILKYTINEKRLSPIEALEKRQGDCSEFADLLVTLHRAANIPSRIKEGVIIDNTPQQRAEGHAWVEFLGTQGWVPCDPTWGLILGVTSQHIEFNTQKAFMETSVYSMEFQGPQPQVSYNIDWSS